jgi:AraC family transcriptional regulator
VKLAVKNMVCQRCVAAVKKIMEDEGLKPEKVSLGEVRLHESELPKEKLIALEKKLVEAGFERIDDKKSRLIERVRNIVVEQIHYRSGHLNLNWSDFITKNLPYDYKYLSNLFSSVEGITIEQYIIRQKVEKAKELIIYDELNLSEIAYRLGYSSIAHFSSQFKKITGMTPSAFKNISNPGRKALDDI